MELFIGIDGYRKTFKMTLILSFENGAHCIASVGRIYTDAIHLTDRFESYSTVKTLSHLV